MRVLSLASIARTDHPRLSDPMCSWRSAGVRIPTILVWKRPDSRRLQGLHRCRRSVGHKHTGIWALGDCNGRGAFTHTAYNDFEIIAANLLDGAHRRLSDRISAYALYIDPPLGRVGQTETQARASGRPLLTAKRPMSRVGRAIEKGETLGFMKVVADAETRKGSSARQFSVPAATKRFTGCSTS